MTNAVIIGGSGAIGQAFTRELVKREETISLSVISRKQPDDQQPGVRYHTLDYLDEASLEQAAIHTAEHGPLDKVIVCTGLLHGDGISPEKSLANLSAEQLLRVYEINTVIPALMAKYFAPRLNKAQRSVFACLSARVGSISDNRMGGWYAYRASKAALNMILKNTAIEVRRTNKNAVVLGLHPGTVDSPLSKPFQANVPAGHLFQPGYAASHLLDVLDKATPDQTGQCLAYDGEEIQP